ncbi:Pimeloyl-ACP methyl ester carboxylesterase [Rhizobium sp. NFR07]|uniref:alpha/beta fold hydrolase n=1 Tax=Rhizobium sp. NFR07 TaxID=1566262 RepID=UPI0008EA22F0|nr:alpha/beta hydrolase [Rhizobium sp. NFR07]SFB03608.1 Pimeloyl-ACP methyl ester carboxylesterase [Rhizobium sp. NFR07]
MAMLLVPGFMLDADLWRDVEPGLSRFGPISHADLSQDATLHDMARRALAEAPPKFILLGFSMGGYVAREIVRQAPERVTALILVATSARGDDDVQAQRKAAIAGQSVLAFRGLSTPAVVSSLHPDNAGRTDLVARIQAMGQRLGGEVFRRQSLLDRHDERNALSGIECPTLVIAGDKDRLRSRTEAVELHEGIRGSSFEVIGNTGHMIPLEAPERLVEVITGWLDMQAGGLRPD